MTIALFVAIAFELAPPPPKAASVCRPSPLVARVMRAYCDRTDGDWHADQFCRDLWSALRTCDRRLTIERRRDTITVMLNNMDWLTMVLKRRKDDDDFEVVAFSWEDCCECPAEPWSDPRLPHSAAR